jgi:peptide/nickel transport system substrate-binding protein
VVNSRSWRNSAFRWLAPIFALTLFAAACGGGDDDSSSGGGGGSDSSAQDADAGTPQPGGEITYGLEAETSGGYCLAEAQLAISGIQVARAIYDTLTAPDENGDIKPFLAESVTPNDDYTMWTIKLRPNVTFHDGSPLDATVVKNNLDAYRGTYPNRTPLLFTFVFSDVQSVDVVDPMTVSVTTKRPWVAFPWFLWSSARLGMMGQAQLDSTSCNRDLIGTGPFKLDSWTVNNALVASKNPDYWAKDADGNQLPYLDKITFKPLEDGRQRVNSLESGDLTMIHTSGPLQIEEIRKQADSGALNNVESDRFGEVGYIMLNASQPPFDNLTARQVLAYGIDRDAVNKIRAAGIPTLAQGPFAPGSVGYLKDAGFPDYDPDKAKDLLAKYKEETGDDLSFTLTHAGDPETTQTAQLYSQLMGEIGVKVNLQPIADQSQLINAAIGGEFQAVTWRNHPGADPDTQYVWWYNQKNPDGTYTNPVNFGRIDSEEINRLLDEGRTTVDQSERKTIYEDLNKTFAKELWNLWASYTIWSIASQPNVHGVLGPDLPEGSKPFPGLATGHPVSGLWISK